VGVAVAVVVGVCVGVSVGVAVGVPVGVAVGVTVGVAVSERNQFTLFPESVELDGLMTSASRLLLSFTSTYDTEVAAVGLILHVLALVEERRERRLLAAPLRVSVPATV